MKKLLNNGVFWAVSLWLLGLADCLFTVYGISSGRGYEVNPLMAWLLSCGYGPFIWVKMGITGVMTGATIMAWSVMGGWPQKLVKAVTLVYLGVAIYHIVGLVWLS